MAASVATARMHTRTVLEGWRLHSLLDDAVLVVSEIVSNAIKATNAIPSQARYPELYDRLEVICLCLYLYGDEVQIEVWDRKQGAPELREAALEDEGGRGLWLVESLSRAWGIRWAVTGGKVVWARVAASE
ncbi:ATP-binding protein [Thermopolyspora sp. NPDC052614]|uniref:ATP-binding protein n=1 Tax=Thermopolyspora sp. NPDC052614 TaxID=3155682 RepID=UPI00343E60A6